MTTRQPMKALMIKLEGRRRMVDDKGVFRGMTEYKWTPSICPACSAKIGAVYGVLPCEACGATLHREVGIIRVVD